MAVYVDTHHIRWRHAVGFNVPGRGDNGRLYQKSGGVMPLTLKKMELSETIGVTLKDDVWCWATDLMVVAEVVCGISSSCVFLRTLCPC